MGDHLLEPLTKDKDALHDLFEKISGGNTILFLGAGASVADKRYLSSDIINYYEDRIGKKFEISNVTELLDSISENKWFVRSEFDSYVHEYLSRLTITDAHRTILSIKWREIITTNYDLLIEKTEYELKEKSNSLFELHYVRNVKEYNHFCDNNQIKYIKLNGCLSDRSKYPLLFSTADFKSAKTFYKTVLDSLKSVSDKVSFVFIGYSFSDDFAKQLLDKFDLTGYRDKRWVYSVDPYPNEHKLAYYQKEKICVIKSSVTDFFESYRKWEEKNFENKLRTFSGPVFTSSKKSTINVGAKLSYNLNGVVEQLNSHYKGKHITEERYYRGEEPNYSVIESGFDIVRQKKLSQITGEIDKIFNNSHSLIPIVFLTGNFGTGKTTFIYRLINEITKIEDKDSTAYEIRDIDNLRKENLNELVQIIKSRQVILYCNNVEIDSVYKSIIELRTFLSSLQFPEINICFLLSIRENILELHKKSRHAKSTFEFNVDSRLSKTEIDELLERLKRNGLVQYRDIIEKNSLVNKIEKEFDGDSFITLLNLISNGKHIDNLRDAYYQLSKQCQKAFVYTALIHRYNLLLPASILRNLVSSDWEDFRTQVINVEGRGILIQDDQVFSKGTDPDLYFRTRHPLIADKLIKEIHPNEEKRFNLYKEIIQKINTDSKTSKFLVNLLKAIRIAKEFKNSRIDSLFDLGHQVFKDEPFYLLQYAINLQARGSKNDVETAIEKISYAETLLEYRNSKFIHRKGVLYFKLAQIYYKEEKSELNLTYKYLEEAKDWLLLKQQLDPSSSFSYCDLLDVHIWELQKILSGKEDEVKKRIFIEDYFDLALNSISDDLSRVIELQEKYKDLFHGQNNSHKYLLQLLEMYEDLGLRPYACILLYSFYSETNDEEKKNELFSEIESYQDKDEALKFLFKYYGRQLSNPNIRMKFYRLAKKMDWYENENPLRYNYYHYVAEAYSMQMQSANNYLRKINDSYQFLNSEYRRPWNEPNSDTPRIFEGSIQKSNKGFKVFKSREFNKEIWFVKEGLDRVNIGDSCKVHLFFFLNGIRAMVIKE